MTTSIYLIYFIGFFTIFFFFKNEKYINIIDTSRSYEIGPKNNRELMNNAKIIFFNISAIFISNLIHSI